MILRILFGLLILMPAQAGEPTPLDQPLPAGEISMIASYSVYGMQQVPGWPRDGLFHYRLYLPHDYHEHQRKYPLLFIASPGGNADMGVLQEKLKRDRWIVAMLVESRNRSILWNPNFVAAYDDLMQRVRVQPEMLFCTGFSGAARVCGTYPGVRPGMQGVILQGAGFLQRPAYLIGVNAGVTVYGLFGNKDPNLPEIANIRRALPKHTRSLFEVWDGGHAWAPLAMAERALQWSVDTVLLDGNADKAYREDLSDMYYWYFQNTLNQYRQAQNPVERWRLNRLLQSLPQRWRLQLDAETVNALQIMAQDAQSDAPALADEIAAYEAYTDALKSEMLARGEALNAMVDVYADISSRYAQTEYGKRAALRRWSLLAEVRKSR